MSEPMHETMTAPTGSFEAFTIIAVGGHQRIAVPADEFAACFRSLHSFKGSVRSNVVGQLLVDRGTSESCYCSEACAGRFVHVLVTQDGEAIDGGCSGKPLQMKVAEFVNSMPIVPK